MRTFLTLLFILTLTGVALGQSLFNPVEFTYTSPVKSALAERQEMRALRIEQRNKTSVLAKSRIPQIEFAAVVGRNSRNDQVVQFDSSVAFQILPGGARENSSKVEYTYTPEGLVAEEAEFTWVNNQWVGDDRATFTYDDQGNPTEIISFIWDSNSSDWAFFSRNSIAYNASSLPVSDSSFLWNPTMQAFVPNEAVAFQYDQNGNQTESVVSSWDGISETFFLEFQLLATYNQLGDPLSFTFNVRDTANGVWVTEGNDEITYNLNGAQEVVVSQINEGGMLVNNFRTTSMLDGNDNLTEIVFDAWNGASWEPQGREVITYNQDNNLLTDTAFFWNGAIWIPEFTQLNKYNGSGYVEENTTSILIDTAMQTLTPEFQALYQYDPLGNPTREEYYVYDAIGGAFENDINFIYTYDIDQPVEGIQAPEFFISNLIPDFSGQTVSQPLTTTIAFSDNMGNDDPIQEIAYFYSDLVTSTRNAFTLEAKIYPNPTSDFITIDWETNGKPAFFELFDLQGRQVLNQQVFGNSQIFIGDLSEGVYFFRLTEEGQAASGRVLIY